MAFIKYKVKRNLRTTKNGLYTYSVTSEWKLSATAEISAEVSVKTETEISASTIFFFPVSAEISVQTTTEMNQNFYKIFFKD